MTALSRYFEFQADEFGRSLGRAEKLCAALVKLNNDNLSYPIYDWLYSAWHHVSIALYFVNANIDTIHSHKLTWNVKGIG